jgi:misacylated tRNA(Ala) deacylase
MEAMYRKDAYATTCEATVSAVDESGIYLDRTVFYPTGGGQPGDSGALRTNDGRQITIIEARKGAEPDSVAHIPAEGSAEIAVGATVTVTIDWDRRHRHMRAHTCMHLLCAVVPYPVTGGQIGDGKARLDFDVSEAKLDKAEISAELNRLIEADHAVSSEWITDAEMAAQPELVRTMSVKPPSGAGHVRLIRVEGLDLQPCGGTHVARTGEIGPVEVTKIQNKGKQNRRVSITLLS